MLEGIDGVTPVHGAYYEMSSNYHKLMGNHAEYYRDALRFLGCTELTDIPSERIIFYTVLYLKGFPVAFVRYYISQSKKNLCFFIFYHSILLIPFSKSGGFFFNIYKELFLKTLFNLINIV